MSLSRSHTAGVRRDGLSYGRAKALARDQDPRVREALAARTDVRPEILYFLAEDEDPAVRRVIAANAATPTHASVRLAGDRDEQVRACLAERIATLAPSLSPVARDNLERFTYEALDLLVRDQATRVRQIISEALKEVSDAPTDVIGQLARDVELVVCEPVLEFSPVLTDADLLEVIWTGPVGGALEAIGRRREVSASVAEAIVASDDESAITVLLGNSSAQIREETLDQLIDRAATVTAWHAPLVRRPRLPFGAAARLAVFVADTLLGELQDRRDLDTESLAQVRDLVRDRLAAAEGEEGADGAEEASGEDAEVRARRLFNAGRLDEDRIGTAVRRGDPDFVTHALALKASVSVEAVARAFVNYSAKGVLALCWKSALSVGCAVEIQRRLARIPPKNLIGVGKTDYPLSRPDMLWQLEFLEDLVRRAGR